MENVRPYEAQFNAKVDRSGGPDACWPWTGRFQYGYGIMSIRSRPRRAHRIAFALAHDGILKVSRGGGHAICHHCDNPPCCNPKHLFEGEQSDNAKDMWNKRRGHVPTPLFGESHPGAVLTKEIVIAMRRARKNGALFKSIYRDFDVEQSAAYDAITGITWPNLDEETPVTKKRKSPKKLTAAIVHEIRTSELSAPELAAKHGVEVTAVRHARCGHTWPNHSTPPRKAVYKNMFHGTRARYRTGCRCSPCCEGSRAYAREKSRRARERSRANI